MVISSGNLYDIDLLSWGSGSGCVDADSGASCEAAVGFTSYNRVTAVAPEPSTLALFATGLALLAFLGWRRRGHDKEPTPLRSA